MIQHSTIKFPLRPCALTTLGHMARPKLASLREHYTLSKIILEISSSPAFLFKGR